MFKHNWKKDRHPQAGAPFRVGGYTVRWVEDPEALGLRTVGLADSILPHLRHRGWYVDIRQDGTTCGIVFQLPARKGYPRFVAAITDPDRDDAIIMEVGETYESAREAAFAADNLAESYAEKAREDEEAWQAEN